MLDDGSTARQLVGFCFAVIRDSYTLEGSVTSSSIMCAVQSPE
jgi:hypothetical protein